MKERSFRLKIFIIFSILALILFSLTFYILNIKYKELVKNSTYLYSAKTIQSISDLLQSIQLERGLSSGYITIKDGLKYKTRLIKRQKITDKDYQLFLSLINKKEIYQFIQINNIQKIINIKQQMKKINFIRKKIFSHSISFKNEFDYYTLINTDLLDILRNLTIINNKYNNSNAVIYDVQAQKETLGQGRAYVYNYILSHNFTVNTLTTINKFISTELLYQQNFLTDTNVKCLTAFNHTINKKLQQKIKTMALHISKYKQTHHEANIWFKSNTKLINEYKTLSSTILASHLANISTLYNNAKITLITIIIVLFSSIILMFVLIYILHTLIKKEEKNKIELKILAYTFDSHEAMIITDSDGKFLRANKAFIDMVGYKQNELLGKTPRILNSGKHSKEFFKNMWKQLQTKGGWSGEIYNKRKDGEIYPEQLSITAIKNDYGKIINYIANYIDISELKRAKDDATFQAYHDFLTTLPNKKFMLKKLTDEFNKARRVGFTHAFFFVDLDGFKSVNDAYGHELGDKLLIKVSNRLNKSIREHDFVARIGGDEFVIILLNINELEANKDIKNIANKIIEEISRIFVIKNHKIKIGVSIGIELFPQNFDNIDIIIKHADIAMYRAKKNGRNGFIFY